MKTLEELRREARLPVVFADEKGRITEVNDRFAAALGWTRAEIVGKRIETIIPSRLRDTHRLGFSRFLRTGRSTIVGQPLELKVLRKDGTEINARHLIIAERLDGHWSFGASIEPLGQS